VILLDICFLNSDHERRYKDYCNRAHIYPDDRERKAMFYIMAGSNDLISKGINNFYNFKENIVKFSPGPEEMEQDFEKFSFCTSSRALTMLALNLYNSGYSSLSVSDTFSYLDGDNMRLAMEAIKLRFNISLTAIEADPQEAIEQKIKNCLN